LSDAVNKMQCSGKKACVGEKGYLKNKTEFRKSAERSENEAKQSLK